MKLAGKKVLISGANQGFGLVVAETFVKAGASVTICSRNRELLELAKKQLESIKAKNAKVIAVTTDVSNPQEVSQLVTTAIAEMQGLDVLIANAGVYGPKGPTDEINWDDWSKAIDINLKGTVLQCCAVLPHFKQKRAGKIIILSGGGATRPLPFLSAYAASKAAVVRFAETLALEVSEFNIDVNAIAPGALNTKMLEEVLAAGPKLVGENFYQQAIKQKQQGGTSLHIGAELCVYLASFESNGITGKLISAIWDPWRKFADYKKELTETDIYTIRRIIPKERNMAWGEMGGEIRGEIGEDVK